MIERINHKLDEWHEKKPKGLIAHLGTLAGLGVGVAVGAVYDVVKVVPVIFDNGPSLLSLETAGEGVVVLGMSAVLGAVSGWKAGELIDHFIEEPPEDI